MVQGLPTCMMYYVLCTMYYPFGSNQIHMICTYYEQSILLYTSFFLSLLVGLGIIIRNWYSRIHTCYTFTLHPSLEVLWSIVPVFFLFCSVLHSLSVLYALESDQTGSTCIAEVIGNQWYWIYNTLESRLIPSKSLPFGSTRLLLVDQPLYIEKGVSTAIQITSSDVIHCWAIPSLGIKMDSVPGRISQITLKCIEEGVYTGFCAELCGSGHSVMPINVVCYSPQ